MSSDDTLHDLAAEVDALAERLADRSLDLLRSALHDAAGEAAAAERLVTRARRSLDKAATLLRSADALGGDDG